MNNNSYFYKKRLLVPTRYNIKSRNSTNLPGMLLAFLQQFCYKTVSRLLENTNAFLIEHVG